jgi:uncharacterized protein YwgA
MNTPPENFVCKNEACQKDAEAINKIAQLLAERQPKVVEFLTKIAQLVERKKKLLDTAGNLLSFTRDYLKNIEQNPPDSQQMDFVQAKTMVKQATLIIDQGEVQRIDRELQQIEYELTEFVVSFMKHTELIVGGVRGKVGGVASTIES